MSSSAAARTASRPSAEPAAELAVVVACHGLVLAFPARHVERLYLRDEVELRPTPPRRPTSPPGGHPAPARLPQVVEAGGEPYAAWNLGTMLDLPPVSTAWVLLRLGAGEQQVPLAVRTGPCLVVQALPRAAALPPGLFRARAAGLCGAFPTAGLRGGRVDAALGLRLDPLRLWSRDELEGSRAAVALARQEGEAR